MILANELRMGNLVSEKVLGIVPVCDIGGGSVWVEANNLKKDKSLEQVRYHITLDNIDPIPLTPEILIDCGFKKDPDDCLSLNKIFYWLGFIQIAIGYAPLINLKHLKYLHQLQNLYFDFYNAELEYKP